MMDMHACISEPVGTSTMLRKSRSIMSTPETGTPLTQMDCRALLMMGQVELPGRGTIILKPWMLGLFIVAKAFHSNSMSFAMRMSSPAWLVVNAKCRRTVRFESCSGRMRARSRGLARAG